MPFVRVSAAVLAFVFGIVLMLMAEFVQWFTNLINSVLPTGGVDIGSGAIALLRGGALLLIIIGVIILYFELRERETGF